MPVRQKKKWVGFLLALAAAGAAAAGAQYAWKQRPQAAPSIDIPVTRVRRGAVTFTVSARGFLQGGNSHMLAAPMTGSQQLVLTDLRRPGELVEKGDVVAQFDTTDEQFRLREAEADLAEAELQVAQAQHEMEAREEELNHELIRARTDVTLAELEVRRNPLIAALAAKQNLLTLEDARRRLSKLEQDYPARSAAAKASIAIQDAARKKAQVQRDVARRNIEMMTLKAPAAGYVNVERNTQSNFFFPGMQFPLFLVGDQVRAGMNVAQIPDLKSWEITAKIAEQDRGHLAIGQPIEVTVIALPGKTWKAKIKDLGGTTGPAWNRSFECKMSLDEGSPDLRPGMSTRMLVTTQTIPQALYLPAQALFESDGKHYVYQRGAAGFVRKTVSLVRRSESQAVIEGLREGETVALANPEERGAGRKDEPKTATKAMGK